MNLNTIRNLLQSQFVIDLTQSDDEAASSPPPKRHHPEPITNKLPVTLSPRTSTQDLKSSQASSTQTPVIVKQTQSVSTQTDVEHWECPVCLEAPMDRTMWNCSHIFCQTCTEIVTTAVPLAECPLCKMIYYKDIKFLKKHCNF